MIDLRRILVATDFEAPSQTALAYGRELARRFGAMLTVVHVTADLSERALIGAGLPVDVGQFQQEATAAARERLDAQVTEQDRRELRVEAVLLTSALPAQAIVAYAADAAVDLIIVGTHGRRPLMQFLLGSVAERVVRTAPCPVLTVRHPEREFLRPDALETVARS